MVDAAAKLNLEANYEKTFSITSQRFAAAKYFYGVASYHALHIRKRNFYL